MTRILATCALAFGILLTASPAVAQDSDTNKEAVSEKITDRSHPDYVRCRTETVIGSRAKKRKVCLTNRQWAEVARDGNAVATRVVEDGRSGMVGN